MDVHLKIPEFQHICPSVCFLRIAIDDPKKELDKNSCVKKNVGLEMSECTYEQEKEQASKWRNQAMRAIKRERANECLHSLL